MINLDIPEKGIFFSYFSLKIILYLIYLTISDKLEIHVLELPKLSKYRYPQTELFRWAQFFGAKSRKEIQMLAEKDDYIQKAYRRLEEMSVDEEKRWEYEARQKAIRDHRHMIASGRREGRREGVEQINLLNQKLLADGRNDDMIRACTDLNFQKQLLEEYSITAPEEDKDETGGIPL